MASAWYLGTYRWQKLSKRVVLEDVSCRLRCSRNCRGYAETADHIVRPRDGGSIWDRSNLQGACRPCNTAKRNMQNRAGRRQW